ncbi:hypothetical protein [Sporomusa sp. GT1]|uniref:hypothetical protein n=1 Tax=Sporomusa sp. GT1 TaxID=1534747 RepID=UPI001CB84426|nr:hypothetical protein [Sporomusa sp. GT1]
MTKQNERPFASYISSEATPDKNRLSTDTLTYSDIENKAEYSASSVGVNLDTRKGAEAKNAGLTPDIGIPVSGDASSTTHSAIAPGTIEVRSNPEQNLSDLSRNPSEALNALGQIFDKKTVQEQQELAKVFGEVAFKEIGDYALRMQEKATTPEEKAKWADGGEYKVFLHTVAGGLMAQLGGGSFTSGAMGAAVNEAVQKALAEKFKDNPAMHQWASAVLGAAAAKVVGGNAQTGASTAASGTKNNYLTHEQYVKYQADLEKLKAALENGDITPEKYSEAVKDVVSYWADIDKKQNKQWLADNNIEAILIDFGSIQIALEKHQYQQMLIELSNSKNDEETAAIKEKWGKISNEQIDKWVAIGKDLGYNLDGSTTSLFPELSTEVVNLNNPYTAWLVKTETENALFWAELSLKSQGIDPNDPRNAQLLVTEVEKQIQVTKEVQDSVMASIGGGLKVVGGVTSNAPKLVSLYRAVGPKEFYQVMKTSEFTVIPSGLQAKQFGLSFEETLKFAEKYSDIGAVIEVKVSANMLNKLGDFTQVDKFIFKNGTVTIQADKLGEFNKIIQEITHKY